MSIGMKLTQLKIEPEEKKEYLKLLRNWLVVSEHLKKEKNPWKILAMIKIELQTNRRPEIIFRLHSRYTSARRKREREELMFLLAEGNDKKDQ